jgi:hypothetical protein
MTLLVSAVLALAPAPCQKTFTIGMFQRAAHSAYAGTRQPTRRDLAHLRRFERCEKTPWGRSFSAGVWKRAKAANYLRRHPPVPPMNGPVTASWFDDSGATACGIHYALGFATLLAIACGQTILMQGPNGALVRATREDSGPYVGGRTFDLNPGLKAALGCGDLCSVSYR